MVTREVHCSVYYKARELLFERSVYNGFDLLAHRIEAHFFEALV
jgi:hypothetical protein